MAFRIIDRERILKMLDGQSALAHVHERDFHRPVPDCGSRMSAALSQKQKFHGDLQRAIQLGTQHIKCP